MNLTNMSKCLKCADKDDIITMKVCVLALTSFSFLSDMQLLLSVER